MDLYFTRHGKTKWNQEMRFQGKDGDSPLLAESYKEIALLGQRLKTIPFERVYSSSSKRASATAKGIVAEWTHPVEIIYDENLREIGLGDLEGTEISEAREKYGNDLEAMRFAPNEYQPERFNGESFEEMIQRTSKAVLAGVYQAKQGPLLFVGHGASLTATIQSLSGQPLEDTRKMGGLSNSSLSILKTESLDLKPPYKLVLWNDQQHLKRH